MVVDVQLADGAQQMVFAVGSPMLCSCAAVAGRGGCPYLFRQGAGRLIGDVSGGLGDGLRFEER
ncbi:hypothetical protein, partial [Streptomyces sp. NPDC005799]|uniref:hypothetical protein n=1 Tax=Streptomyces sp. NPDC005799 TaxID=3154678 RepID=UPI00340D3189